MLIKSPAEHLIQLGKPLISVPEQRKHHCTENTPQHRICSHCPVQTPKQFNQANTEIKLSFENHASSVAPLPLPCATGVKQFRAPTVVLSQRWRNCRLTRETLVQDQYVLVNGLEEFPLVLPDSGVVHLPHQLGVLVDEPSLPENVCSSVLHLRSREYTVTHTPALPFLPELHFSWCVSYISLQTLA